MSQQISSSLGHCLKAVADMLKGLTIVSRDSLPRTVAEDIGELSRRLASGEASVVHALPDSIVSALGVQILKAVEIANLSGRAEWLTSFLIDNMEDAHEE